MKQSAPQQRKNAPQSAQGALGVTMPHLCENGCGKEARVRFCSGACRSEAWKDANLMRKPKHRTPLVTHKLATYRLAAQWLKKQEEA